MATDTKKRRRVRRSRDSNDISKIKTDPFIKRNIPYYEMLDEEGISKIEEHAEIILEEFGIQFRGDKTAAQLFVDAGAEYDKNDKEIVHFPRGLVKKLASTAPREFTHHARNPAKTVTIGGDNLVLVPAYGSPFVLDMDNGRR